MQLKPIKPKNLSAQFKALPKAVDKGMREAAEAVKKDFESTTENWKHKVTFSITPDGPNYIVSTEDEIWKFVDEGTPEHDIFPRNKKALKIGIGGFPKTMPGRLRSGSGGKPSIILVRPHVHHPGTEPRDFSGTIAKRWARGVAPFIRKAIEEVLK